MSLLSFQTLHFICNCDLFDRKLRLQSIQNHHRLFPSLCTLTSEVSVLFDWNLSRLPFLRQVVNLDLLLCAGFNSEHADLFLCLFFSETNAQSKD